MMQCNVLNKVLSYLSPQLYGLWNRYPKPNLWWRPPSGV